MIISRTPYRVSFFGGGTDYHTWYQEHGGQVLSTSINHYNYITCSYRPSFFESKHRIVWSKVEDVQNNSEINHPVVRALFEYMNIQVGMEVHYHGDLPARSGLGSSSAFTVGLLNALYALQGEMSTKRQLACEAVHIERDILKENVGVQDQIATAFGGFNKVTINPNGTFEVHPVIAEYERVKDLQKHFLLFFTGVSRTASTIAGKKMAALPKKKLELNEMSAMVDEALKILCSNRDINDFGKLLHETWLLKKSLSSEIAPGFVDEIYERGRNAGAIGGKLLGAGGGGFILFFAESHNHQKIKEALNDLLYVPFEFENNGSSIIFHEHTNYSRSSIIRKDYQHLKKSEDMTNVKAINSEKSFDRYNQNLKFSIVCEG